MDDAIAKLEAEYCPPIDPALLSAIVSDYDLHNEDSLKDARATLDLIKSTADVEEATGFDASGSATYLDEAPEHASVAPDASTTSRDTDVTSLSNDLSTLDIGNINAEEIENLDEATKIAILKEVFPSLSDYTITFALKKYGTNWKQVLDELLNQVYFSENNDDGQGDRVPAKGIEAFSEDNIARRGRKNKRKAKRAVEDATRSASFSSAASEGEIHSNMWQSAKKDIDLIALHSGMSVTTVSSVYYAQNASLPKTIGTLLKQYLEENKEASRDPILQAHAFQLGQDFPSVAPKYLAAIIKLTHPSMTSAEELAKALTTKKTSRDSSQHLVPRYAPISLSDEDDYQSLKSSRERSGSPLPIMDLDLASTAAGRSAIARQAALAQARAAYRKSKSNHLMGGAAAYYSQVGREHSDTSQYYSSAAADALVNSQSTALEIDLHGVNVQDAVRISRQRVHSWWHNLGESKVNGRVGADDRARGMRIVTGVGKHSVGGRGVIGPAVKKMLEQEGWRIESGSGVILVKGRAKNV